MLVLWASRVYRESGQTWARPWGGGAVDVSHEAAKQIPDCFGVRYTADGSESGLVWRWETTTPYGVWG
jgi:hypothetical protein